MTKKRLTGIVVSDKMQKTVVVSVEMFKKHAIYHKVIKNTRKFKARNEIGVKMDDRVVIEETKPFSKEVTWLVVGKIEEQKK